MIIFPDNISYNKSVNVYIEVISSHTSTVVMDKTDCFNEGHEPSTQNLNSDTKIRTGEKPLSCPVCNKAFSYKSLLDEHVRSHTGERPFACTVCGKSFKRKSNLNEHSQIHTSEKQKQDRSGVMPLVCSVCDKAFTSKKNLVAHSKSHTAEKQPFTCQVCPQNVLAKTQSYPTCTRSQW